jgi:hypothetical protein
MVSLSPGLGEAEAPPRSRSSLSSEAEPESEPWGRTKRSSSSSGAEPESEPGGRAMWSSSSSGAEPESEPWVGRGGVRRLSGLSPSPSPGSGEAELPMALEAGLGCCQPQYAEWRRRRCPFVRPVRGAAK